MGDKAANYVSWLDAARVANCLQNGQGSGSTETGASTLNNAPGGNAPAVNSVAQFYIPTENQGYKAAYYKGGSTNAGYWDYATQSDTDPTAVTADSTGIGSAGSTGNCANLNLRAHWNSLNGNVTTVGTNGGASAYGAFDMSGNLYEWNDLDGLAASGSSRGRRLERQRSVRLVVRQQHLARPVERDQRLRVSSRKSGCRARAVDVGDGSGWACLCGVASGSASHARLTRTIQRDSKTRGALSLAMRS